MDQICIGSILKRLIEEHGISLKELSVKTSIPYSTLHTWLQNSAPKDIVKVKRLASYFGVSLNYLLFAEDKNAEDKTEEIKARKLDEEVFKGLFEITIKKIE